MDRRGRRDLDDQDAAGRPLRRHAVDAVVEGRLDAVRADLRHEAHERVESAGVEALRPPVVRHAQDQTSAAPVAERGQLVGERIAAGSGDPVPPEGDALDLQFAVLAKSDLPPELRWIYRHYPASVSS